VAATKRRRERSALETLGDMISEAFHQHKIAVANKKRTNAKKAAKQTSTAAEVSQWGGVTSVRGIDFSKFKK